MRERINPISAHAFDMFCSVGGLTYGLQQAGLKVNAGLDVDASCRYAYEKNCDASFMEADIRDISYSDISDHFNEAKYRVLVGCAPCQPFSSLASSRKLHESDHRWTLINEFLRVILDGRPEVVSMENVPKLIKQPVYREFKRRLSNVGYHISEDIVACSRFGVPQSRRRLVMLGSLLGKVDMPEPGSVEPKTVRHIIGSLPCLQHGESSGADPLHVCSRLDSINLKRIQASRPGGSWLRDWTDDLLPNCYRKDSGKTYGSVYGRMQWDALAPTITTQFYRYGTGRFGHPDQDRAISLREGALLQTFPEDYQFLVPGNFSFNVIGRHIGNAVPPSLAFAIGKAINCHLKARDEKGV